jgi:hypothetical protein
MIRRISSLALGIAIACFATSALAQEEGGEAAPAEEAPAAEPAAGGGEAAAGGTAAASTDALPDSKGAFGKSGQIAISQDFSLQFESRTTKPPDPPGGDSAKTTTITLGPALDYFVADSISVGGRILFQSVSGENDSGSSTIGIGPRVGYNLGLADNISLWPKLSFAYAMTTIKGDPDDTKLTKMILGVDVPVLFHPAQHFFIGLGPYFEMDLSSKAKVGDNDGDGPKDTAFGARTVVGGWF